MSAIGTDGAPRDCLQLVHSERGASRDGHARILEDFVRAPTRPAYA
jgi:hypothetical protein